ncbi:MAG: FHA domain-containing protein [Candidatus Acidiferrum sp.]
MRITLEVKSGPFAGRKIPLRIGESVLIGRAPERAQFAVPHDNLMSGVHFAVEYGADGCRVVDKRSTNGTSLNGAKIPEAMLLANGDEIKSGQTVFVVHMVPDDQLSGPSANPPARGQRPAAVPQGISDSASKNASTTPASAPARATSATSSPPAPPARTSQPPALAIGDWAFHKIPDGWKIQEGLGIQQDVEDAFPASIGAMQELLGPDITLPKYVEAQSKMLREYLPEPKIEDAAAPAISGSEEASALDIRFHLKDGPSVCFHRVYACSGSVIGVLTLTALERDLAALRPIYDAVLAAVSFSRKE